MYEGGYDEGLSTKTRVILIIIVGGVCGIIVSTYVALVLSYILNGHNQN